MLDYQSLAQSSFRRTWTVSQNILCTYKLAYNIQKTFYFYPSEITIGFEQGTYTVQEDQPTVEVCAEILQGSVERSTAVTFMFEDQNGLAGAAKFAN